MTERVDDSTIAFAHRLADAAGEVIRPYFRKTIEVIDKSKSGPPTKPDHGKGGHGKGGHGKSGHGNSGHGGGKK